MCVLSQSVMSHSAAHGLYPVRLFCPWGFSRQEYWSGLPYSPPGDLPNPEIKPRSPTLQVDSLPSEPPGKPKNNGVGSLSLLQANFLTQKLNQGLLHYQQILYQLSSIVGCKEYNRSYFGIDHLVMSCVVISCMAEVSVCYDQCVLLAKLC